MRNWLRDLRFACRVLGRAKTATAVAVLTLGLGIGMNTAIFSGVYAFLWAPFPYPEADQLVWLSQTNPAQGFQQASVSWRDAEDWRGAHSLESLALFRSRSMGLSGSGEPATVFAVMATPEFLRVLRVQPALGRGFGAAEQAAGEHRVAIVSDGLWRRQFGARREVLGREIRLDGRNYAVIGIMPPDFTFLYRDADVFLPLYPSPEALTNRGYRSFQAIGRLAAGATIAQAQAEIRAISARVEGEAPDTNQGWTGKVWALDEQVIPRNARLASHTALLAVGFVLLIACANIANLLLARGTLRRRELAVRASLGAGRLQLMRLLLAESMALAVIGAALGVVFAYWGVPLLKSVVPPDMPRTQFMTLNATALLYTAGLCVATGLLAGLAPAWLLSRGGLAASLQDSSRGSTGGRQVLLKALVVGEVAVAVLLLAASGLMIRSLDFQINASPGFDKTNLLTARVSLPQARYPAPAQVADFFKRALAGLRSNAQVRDAAAADTLPLGGSFSWQGITIEGRATTDLRRRNMVGSIVVTPGYFRTIGIPMVAGRDFDDRDGPDSLPVAIVNETMAQRYWSGAADVVGRRFKPGGPSSPAKWITVAGVAKDVRHQNAALPARPEFYLPHAQSPSPAMTLIARTAVDPGRLAGAMRAAVRSLDRDQPLYQLESLEDMLARRAGSSRAFAQILGFLAGLALLLAAIGVYGLMAYMASQRAREIGVRIALGARPGDIFRMVLRGGVWLMLAGLAIGLPCAYGVTPLLRSLLTGIQPHDTATFVTVPLILMAVALVACGLPARRAMRLDPVVTLRAE